MLNAYGAGQFCMCGCQEASGSISQLQQCALSAIMSIIATSISSPRYREIMEKHQPDIFQKMQAIYDKFLAYKEAHPEDKRGLSFLKSDESPCASLRSTAIAACKKCPACKYFL